MTTLYLGHPYVQNSEISMREYFIRHSWFFERLISMSISTRSS